MQTSNPLLARATRFHHPIRHLQEVSATSLRLVRAPLLASPAIGLLLLAEPPMNVIIPLSLRIFRNMTDLFRVSLRNQDLSDLVALVLPADPLARAEMRWSCSLPTTTDSQHDEVPGSVFRIFCHPFENAAVYLCVSRHVTNLTTRQGPADGFPGAVWLKIHSSERL
jgi:hypothetical protein